MTDIETTWTPSFVLVCARSAVGRAWCYRNIDAERWVPTPVDHRYIADIVNGARADGLTVETTN